MDDLARYSFSTSWNWRGSEDGARVMGEILALGFRSVELNYRVKEQMMKDIRSMVRRGEVQVSSVHNVFPDVCDETFGTDSRLLGYEDRGLRDRAVALTIRSVEEAAALGARAVVVHAGELPWDALPPGPSGRTGPVYHRDLCALFRTGMRESPVYRKLLEEFLAYRSGGIREELDRVTAGLEAVASHIVRHALPVMVGVENRANVWQIPTLSEAEYLLDRLAGAPVGLWFDTGHGTIMRNLGLFDDRVEVQRLRSRLVGMHIHDTQGIDDHWAPYQKTYDLDAYLDLIADVPLKVLELGAKNPAAVIPGAARELSRRMDGRNRATAQYQSDASADHQNVRQGASR